MLRDLGGCAGPNQLGPVSLHSHGPAHPAKQLKPGLPAAPIKAKAVWPGPTL